MFFTADAQDADRREAMDAGGDAFLIKPNDLEKLTSTVMTLLESRWVEGKRIELDGAASGNRTHDIQNHNLAF